MCDGLGGMTAGRNEMQIFLHPKQEPAGKAFVRIDWRI